MNDTKIVLPHGGYSKLICFKKSEVVYQGTVVFCRRFLPSHGDRTVDQMTQAARSCKQNLAEGSAASGTSKETEMKLTGVARATLDERLEDYRDFLRSHGWKNGVQNILGESNSAIGQKSTMNGRTGPFYRKSWMPNRLRMR